MSDLHDCPATGGLACATHVLPFHSVTEGKIWWDVMSCHVVCMFSPTYIHVHIHTPKHLGMLITNVERRKYTYTQSHTNTHEHFMMSESESNSRYST